MNRASSNFLAFLTGAAVGGVLGILYAPDKGSNTRDKLTYRLDKYRESLQELYDQLYEGKTLPEGKAKHEGQRIISDAKEKAERLLDDVDELIGQIKSR